GNLPARQRRSPTEAQSPAPGARTARGRSGGDRASSRFAHAHPGAHRRRPLPSGPSSARPACPAAAAGFLVAPGGRARRRVSPYHLSAPCLAPLNLGPSFLQTLTVRKHFTRPL